MIEAVPYFTNNMLADPPLVSEFAALHGAFEAGNDSFREHEAPDRRVRQSVPPSRQRRRPHRAGAARSVLVRKVIEIMQARLGERLLLEELAGVVGLTVFQLIGLFKRTIGTSRMST